MLNPSGKDKRPDVLEQARQMLSDGDLYEVGYIDGEGVYLRGRYGSMIALGDDDPAGFARLAENYIFPEQRDRIDYLERKQRKIGDERGADVFLSLVAGGMSVLFDSSAYLHYEEIRQEPFRSDAVLTDMTRQAEAYCSAIEQEAMPINSTTCLLRSADASIAPYCAAVDHRGPAAQQILSGDCVPTKTLALADAWQDSQMQSLSLCAAGGGVVTALSVYFLYAVWRQSKNLAEINKGLKAIDMMREKLQLCLSQQSPS